MKKTGTKFTATLLAILMIISLLPTFALAADTPTLANHVVINQVYGGGGNSGADYKNDFIELFNPTASDVSLADWSVQYTNTSGTTWQVTNLSGTIKAGRYYLIQEAAGNGGTKDLPTPDATGSIAMAGSNFKVALFKSTTEFSGKAPTDAVDFVGAGTADSYEGTSCAPAPSNTTSICRTPDGVDTDVNSADFTAVTPNPRNSNYDPNAVPAATPTASVATGSKVKAGDVITFSTATDGATLTCKVNGTDTTLTSGKYTVSGQPGDKLTIAITASKTGMTDSAATFSYTVDWTTQPYAKAVTGNAIKDGDVVYIYGYEKGVALTGDVKSSYYLAGAAAAVDSNGFLTLPVEAAALTVEVTAATESTPVYYSFKNAADKYLLASDRGNMSFGDTSDYAKWELETSGTHIKLKNATATYTNTSVTPNTTAPRYAEYNSSSAYFGAYNYNSTYADAYLLDFYAMTSEVPPAEPTITDINKTSEAGASYTVKGIVTFVDGKNVVIQDATGGINLYFSTAPSVNTGDQIIATGKKSAFNGLQQLTNATIDKTVSVGNALPSAEKTVAEIITDMAGSSTLESTRVVIKNVIIGSINTAGLTKLSDDKGNTINVYKMPELSGVETGDTVTITAIVSDSNGAQLRVVSAADVTAVEDGCISIAEALAKDIDTTGIKVKGVVTFIDGNNIYIQDSTGGIVLYLTKDTVPSALAIGDCVTGTGKRAVYKGLPELSGIGGSSDAFKILSTSNDLPEAVEVTISQLNKNPSAYLCKRVYITEGTLGAIATSGNTPLTQGANNVNIYKLPEVTQVEGNRVNLTAVVGIYTSLQLRVASATDVQTVTYAKRTAETLKAGDAVVFFCGKKPASMSTATGNSSTLAGIDATDNSGYITVTADTAVLTVEKSGDNYKFKNAAGKYLTSGATGNSLTFAAAPTGTNTDYGLWILEPQTVDSTLTGYRIKNVNAVYKSAAQYIEYFSNYGGFKTTSYSSNYKDYYLINFYAPTNEIPAYVEKEIAPRTVADGDYFIYSDSAKGVMKYAYGDSAGMVSATLNEAGTAVKLGENYTGAAIYTLAYQESGAGAGMYTIAISGSGKYLSASYGKFGLNATVNDYCYWRVEASGDGWNIINNKSGQYIEYYSSNGFCMYTYKADNAAIYIMKLCAATEAQKALATDTAHPGYIGTWPSAGDKPVDGGKYLIWNKYSSYAFGPLGTDESTSYFTFAKATMSNNALVGENGALIFTVTTDGTYYTFENNGKYLACSTNKDDGGNDENLLLLDTLTDYCYWTLQETENGYVIFNKTGAYNSSKVCPEYYSGMFSGWTYKAGNNDIFAFQFHAAEDTYGTGYVVNPKVVFNTVKDANRGVDYPVSFTLDDLGETKSVDVSVTFTDGTNSNTVSYTPTMTGYKGAFTIPASDIAAYSSMTITISAVSKESATHNANYSGDQTITINDLPAIVSVSPASNEQTGDNKRPTVTVNYANTGDGATYAMAINGTTVAASAADGKLTYTTGEDIPDGKITVTATITRADKKSVTKTWSFYVGKSPSTPYFGQIHSHTSEYSDGSGSLESAYEYAMNQAQDVDFLIVTDHSNYFDTTSTATTDSMYNAGASSLLKNAAGTQTLWQEARATAKYYDGLRSDFVCGYGYEMTWSGGPGHMNTFNSLGIVSRNNSDLNNKSSYKGMLAYYDLMADANEKGDTYTTGQIVAMFNHPGDTFGTFGDFTGWTEERDAIINLIEVGNGDGNEEGTSYWSSYQYYDEALSLGWHLAPTNNQDNHKGRWGDANTCRTVVLTGNFTEAGLYEAMALRHVYSTEDQNLTVIYTMGDYLQGDIATNYAEDNVTLTASISDANDEALGTVYIIGENGQNAPIKTITGITGNSYELSETIATNTSAYYYIMVKEADGDIAVTAPIWVDEVAATKYNAKASVSYIGTPVQDTKTTVTATLTNSVDEAISLTGYTLTVDGAVVKTETGLKVSVAKDAAVYVNYDWTPATYGSHTVAVTFNVTLSDGTTKLTPSASKKIYVKGTDYAKVSTIADAKKVNEATGKGTEFTIQGTVTSNASGYDKDNAFFDCIYVQDDTGGINVFPVSGEYQVGQAVELHGGITWYCGEIELNLSEDYGGYIKVIDSAAALTPIAPTKVTCAASMSDENIGLLMEVSGTVTSVHESAGIIDRIYVSDGSGTDACLYINGYILNSTDKSTDFSGTVPKVGDKVTGVGLGSRDVDELNGGYLARLRVRDRSEITVTAAPAGNAVVDIPVAGKTDSVNVSAAISGTTASVQATQSQLSAISQLAEAGSAVTVDLTGLNVTAAVLPEALMGAVAQSGVAVAFRFATVTLNPEALVVAGTGALTVSAREVSLTGLTAPQRDALGDRLDSVRRLDLSVSNAAGVLAGFDTGDIKVTVSSNSMAKAGVYTVDENGTLEYVMTYLNGDVISFYPPHFSLFVIGTFPFDDVAGTNWAYGDVVYAYNNSLFNGISADAFGPDVTMTRQMVWTVLARMDGETPANYAEARDWAMKNGISDGSSPAADVTREQLATLIYRYEQLKGGGFTGSWMFKLPYGDTASISEWAYEGLAWCHMNGIVNGVGNNLVVPQGDALRSQVAAMLHRYCTLSK